MRMRNKITMGASIAVTTLISFQTPQSWQEENIPVVSTKEEEIQESDAPSAVKTHEDDTVNQSNQIPVSLVKTIDGDTIKVRVYGKMETVRYLLVDTPESKKPGMCVQPYAKEAIERNNQLVRDGKLTLEFEQGNTRDSYGRLLAYVYVDGLSIQETLLKEGFARVAYIMDPPYKFLNLYTADENLAKRSQVNIWSLQGYVTNRGFVGWVSYGG
jgi:micrococcal nuclease